MGENMTERKLDLNHYMARLRACKTTADQEDVLRLVYGLGHTHGAQIQRKRNEILQRMVDDAYPDVGM